MLAQFVISCDILNGGEGRGLVHINRESHSYDVVDIF